MPRIPIYGEHQVGTSGLPSVPQQSKISQEDALMFAGGTDTAAFAKMAQGVSEAAFLIQDTNDKAKVTEHASVMSLAVAEHHAALDKMTGAEAQQITKTNQDFWASFRSKTAESLTERQRFMFSPLMGRMEASSRESSIKAEAVGVDKYLDMTLQGRQDTAAAAAQASTNNPDLLLAHKQSYLEAVSGQVSRLKLEGDAKDKYVRDQMVKFHEPIIDKLLTTDAEGAKEYYYSNIKSIPSDNRAQIEAKIERGTSVQTAQKDSDAAIKTYGYNEPAAIKHLSETLTGKRREEAISQYEKSSQTNFVMESRRYEPISYDLMVKVEQGVSPNKIRQSPEYIGLPSKYKIAVEQAFDAYESEVRTRRNEARIDADRALGSKAERAAAAKDANYAAMIELAQKDEQKFMDQDFVLMGSHFTATQRNELIELKQRMLTGGDKDWSPDKALAVGTEQAKALGLKNAALYQFRSALRADIAAESKATLKPPSPERVEQMTTRLLTKGVQKNAGWFGFDKTTRAFAADKEKPFVSKDGFTLPTRISDVPAKYLPKIREALRIEGKALTSENIIEKYEKHKGKLQP